jgi:colanic acid/amylovoran biosynthesis protein
MKNTKFNKPGPPTILMINLHSSRNAGDAALAITAVAQMQANFPGCRVILSMNDPESHASDEPKVGSFMRFFHPISEDGSVRWNGFTMLRLGICSLLTGLVYRLFRRSIFFGLPLDQKTFLQAYLDADLIASAPGNFLYSSGKFGMSLLVIVYSLVYALLLGKPIYILPQSIGPFRSGWERWLVNTTLKRARMILVREPVSLQNLVATGLKHPRLCQVPDLAFAFQGEGAHTAREWLRSKGVHVDRDRPLLGVTTINWAAQSAQSHIQETYENAIFAAARSFTDQLGGKVVFFPQVYGATEAADDRIPARRISQRLTEAGLPVTLIEEPTRPALLKTAYGFMDVFIGTRMHSNIFALTAGVPVLAIAYRYKTQGLMQLVGLSEWVVDIQQADEARLVSMLMELWTMREALKPEIERRVAVLAEEAQKTGALIAADFNSLRGEG